MKKNVALTLSAALLLSISTLAFTASAQDENALTTPDASAPSGIQNSTPQLPTAQAAVTGLSRSTPAATPTFTGTDPNKGYQVGRFLMQPSISVTEEYDDNIYAQETNEQDDFITTISPKIVAKLTDTPHRLQFSAGLDQVLYAEDSDDNFLNYNAGVTGRYYADKTMYFDGLADYRHLHSRRGDDQANPTNDASEPLPYNVSRVKTSMTKNIDRFRLQPALGYVRYDFENVRRKNGALIDQNFRDRDEYELGGRLSYLTGEDMSVFTDLQYNPREYDDNSAVERDSDGGSYLAGIRYTPENIVAELAAGYMDRDYDRNVYEDIDTYDIAARFDYTYAPNSQVKLSFNRAISEVTDGNVGGAIRSDVRAAVTKELTTDLVGHVRGAYINSAYEGGNGADDGGDREDDYYEAGAGLTYTLRENVALTANYIYGKNQSNRDTSDYDNNSILFGVKIGY